MHPRFQTAFAQLADNLQSALEPILADKYFPALLTGEQVSSLKSATGLDEDALAFALLPLAAACARTPLSNFNVGAIARGVSGTWYFGANMEFIGATMQQTVHAEQSAISHAWLSGEKALAAITVNYTPCGHCRQFMNELNSGLDLRIHLPWPRGYCLEWLREHDAFQCCDRHGTSQLPRAHGLAQPRQSSECRPDLNQTRPTARR